MRQFIAESGATERNAGQVQFLEKKLKLQEDKTEALKNLLTSKDDEIEKVLH